MKTSDFDYHLPQDRIAQTPLEDRTSSKLLVLDRKNDSLEDRHFYDIVDYLNPGDCLILNNSKVLPARIYGKKEVTNANIEFLLHKQINLNRWEVMAKPAKRLKIGTKVIFSDELQAEVIKKNNDGLLIVDFLYEGSLYEILHKIGMMPLPPYIKEKLEDQNRYQTVYAQKEGSSAAPTAGLHFTDDLICRIKEKGVSVAYVTLHVGLGTFLPVSSDDISEHHMHSEFYEIDKQTADLINETKAKNKKVIAVGTTSVRTLESNARKHNCRIQAVSEETDIFIYPGYQFHIVDALITNFHLPKSTLLMLVSAFYSRENILHAYQYAIDHDYRFFSFGDAMLIL